MSQKPARIGGHRHCGIGNSLSLSHDLARSLDQKVMQLYGQKPLKVSHHPTKFGDQRHCGSRDIMVLMCDVILQNRMIEGSCDFMGGIPLW